MGMAIYTRRTLLQVLSLFHIQVIVAGMVNWDKLNAVKCRD